MIQCGDFVEGGISCGIVVDVYKGWVLYKNQGEIYCEYEKDCQKTDRYKSFRLSKRSNKKFKVGDKVVGDNSVGVITKIVDHQWYFVKDEEEGIEIPETAHCLETWSEDI